MYTKLEELARLNRTDKYDHGYMPLYANLFEPFRFEAMRILEIGYAKGRGAATLEEYFPKSVIHCIDHKKDKVLRYFELPARQKLQRMFLWQGDQSSKSDLENVINEIKLTSKSDDITFKIIIDDGSHDPKHQITSYETLFPYVAPGGYYIIEDMHPYYKDGYHRTVGYFNELIHKINKNGDIGSKTTTDIEWVMFPYNRIVIKKRD